MTDRIDHAAAARRHVEWAHEWQGDEGSTDATNIATVLLAQTHATLALVEQQRIANLIALAGASDSIRARQQAEEVLYQPTPVQAGIDLPLSPEIADALGIEAVEHE